MPTETNDNGFEYSLGGWAPLPDAIRSVEAQQQAEADYQLAVSEWKAGNFRAVGPLLEHALQLAPDHASAHAAFAWWSCEREDHDRALLHSQRAIELAPNDLDAVVIRSRVLERTGQPEAAWRLVEPLLAGEIVTYPLAVVYGRLAPFLKQERQALAYIEPLLESPVVSEGEMAPLYFTAGTLYDRLGQHDEAFRLVRRAKETRRTPDDERYLKRRVDRLIDYYTPARLRTLPRASHGTGRPVFIVGMPRSGTSLVEQILASHPQVHGAGELRTIGCMIDSTPMTPWAAGLMYPESFDAISAADIDALAGTYLSSIASLNATATYVTDKNPMNFLELGLLELLFPACHVIHCVRDPLDTCVSCYMTLFEMEGFTQGLSSLGIAYRSYLRLMAHWKALVRLPVLEVRYEELVADIEGQSRRMLQFLDLPWDARCLKYYENKRRVLSPSRDQVHQPVYSSSIGRWRHYEKHIGELITALSLSPEPASLSPVPRGEAR